jgi:hypothetical protein
MAWAGRVRLGPPEARGRTLAPVRGRAQRAYFTGVEAMTISLRRRVFRTFYAALDTGAPAIFLAGLNDRDLALMHVEPGHTRMDDIHACLPANPRYWTRARRPQSPLQDRDPVTRARSGNPG